MAFGSTIIFGPDPVATEVARVLGLLQVGDVDQARLESKQVDLKEEAGRRRGAEILPADTENETAARALTVEAACMANTEGGGALIVGVADNGQLIGTELDTEWLRFRIYERTQRLLTVSIWAAGRENRRGAGFYYVPTG
jgi:ATP-dependent DNA helicase RecG